MRMPLITAALTLMLASPALAKSAAEMSTQERMAFAAAIMICDDERHDPEKRVDACTLVLRLRENQVSAETAAAYHAYRGNAYRELGKYDDAMDDYEEAIKKDPAVVDSYAGRALLHRALHKRAEAIADADKAVELSAKHPLSLSIRAMVLRETAPEKALADIEQALLAAPESSGIIAERAAILIELGQYDRAIADSTKALALNPNLAEALAIRCLARGAQDKLAEALLDCDTAVNRFPKSVNTRNARGLTLLKLQKYDEAINEFDEALEVDENSPTALYARGIAKQKKGSASSGKRDIDKALSVDATIVDRMAKRGIVP